MPPRRNLARDRTGDWRADRLLPDAGAAGAELHEAATKLVEAWRW